MAIESIKVGYVVISTSFDTFDTTEKKVLKTFVNSTHEDIRLLVRFEAYRIVSAKRITDPPGFSDLSETDQISVMNTPENFMRLWKSTNASKGAKSWTEWEGHSKLGPVPEVVRQEMIQREQSAYQSILDAIKG